MSTAPRPGFTMVELLVALAVAGLVVLAAFGMVSFAAESSTRLRESGAEALSGAGARATLETWARAATLAGGVEPFVGVERDGPDGPLDEVSFTVADGGATQPGAHRVRLWVDLDVATDRTGLVAELSRRVGQTVRAETLEVAPAATGLSLRYRMRVVGGERWVDGWSVERELPLAVELRVVGPAASARAGVSGLPRLLSVPIVVRLNQAAS